MAPCSQTLADGWCEVAGRGRIENEVWGVVPIDHRIHVEKYLVAEWNLTRGFEPSHRVQRCNWQESNNRRWHPVDDAGGELPDLSDMRTKNFPSRLLRKPCGTTTIDTRMAAAITLAMTNTSRRNWRGEAVVGRCKPTSVLIGSRDDAGRGTLWPSRLESICYFRVRPSQQQPRRVNKAFIAWGRPRSSAWVAACYRASQSAWCQERTLGVARRRDVIRRPARKSGFRFRLQHYLRDPFGDHSL